MRNKLASLRGMRPARFITIAIVVLAVMLVVAVSAAIAVSSVPAPPANPTSADQIQNVDQVKTAIKAYYGDTVSNVPDPVNGATFLHFASPTSAYANEMHGIENDADKYLAKSIKHFDKGHGHGAQGSETPAVVFDIDDTTLNPRPATRSTATSSSTRRRMRPSSTRASSRPCSGCRTSSRMRSRTGTRSSS